MRTTIDIDAELLKLLRERAFRSGKSFKETVNAVVRRGLQSPAPSAGRSEAYRCPTVSLGRSSFDLDKALALASDLEDSEAVRDLQLRK